MPATLVPTQVWYRSVHSSVLPCSAALPGPARRACSDLPAPSTSAPALPQGRGPRRDPDPTPKLADSLAKSLHNITIPGTWFFFWQWHYARTQMLISNLCAVEIWSGSCRGERLSPATGQSRPKASGKAAVGRQACGIISKIKVLHLKIKVYMKTCNVHPLRKSKRSSEDGTQLQQACEESTNTATPCNTP